MSCIQTQVSLGLLPRPKKHKLCCFSKPGNHRPKWAIASIASCEIAVIRATFASDSLGDVPMKPSLWVICWQCFHAYPSLPALYYYHFRWWVHRYTQHGPINPSAPYEFRVNPIEQPCCVHFHVRFHGWRRTAALSWLPAARGARRFCGFGVARIQQISGRKCLPQK